MTSEYKVMYPVNFTTVLNTDIDRLINKMLEELVVNVQTAVAAGTIRGRDDTPITFTDSALAKIPIVHKDVPSPDTSAIGVTTITVPDTMDQGIEQAYRLVKYTDKNSTEIAIEEFVQAYVANSLTDMVKRMFRERLNTNKPAAAKNARRVVKKKK